MLRPPPSPGTSPPQGGLLLQGQRNVASCFRVSEPLLKDSLLRVITLRILSHDLPQNQLQIRKINFVREYILIKAVTTKSCSQTQSTFKGNPAECVYQQAKILGSSEFDHCETTFEWQLSDQTLVSYIGLAHRSVFPIEYCKYVPNWVIGHVLQFGFSCSWLFTLGEASCHAVWEASVERSMWQVNDSPNQQPQEWAWKQFLQLLQMTAALANSLHLNCNPMGDLEPETSN